jgi:hypothetical protein
MSGSRHALDLVPGLARLARAQDDVVSRAQLRDLGVDADDVAEQEDALRWRCVGPHVVVLHRGGISRDAAFRLALLHAGEHAALAAWSALERYGLRRWERPALHVLVERGRSVPPLPNLTVHESRRYQPERDAQLWRGLRSVTRARAAVDAASWERRPDTGVALLAAVTQQRVCAAAGLRSELESAGAIRHRRHLAVHLGVIADGADTLGEIWVARILREAGLPAPRHQTPVWVDGRRCRTDCEVDLPDGGILKLEVDGDDHDDLRARAHDSLKDLASAADGRPTVRITPWMVRHRRPALVAALRAVRIAAEQRVVSGRTGSGTSSR